MSYPRSSQQKNQQPPTSRFGSERGEYGATREIVEVVMNQQGALYALLERFEWPPYSDAPWSWLLDCSDYSSTHNLH